MTKLPTPDEIVGVLMELDWSRTISANERASEIMDAVMQLHNAARAGVADSERLDWLEANARQVHPKSACVFADSQLHAFTGENFRAAIDAARGVDPGETTRPSEAPLCLERFDHVTAPHKISQGITRPQCELPQGHKGPHGFSRGVDTPAPTEREWAEIETTCALLLGNCRSGDISCADALWNEIKALIELAKRVAPAPAREGA